MASEDRIREIARRVAASVLAERGRASHPAGRPETPGAERIAGVHVVANECGEPLRPSNAREQGTDARVGANTAALVTARDLAAIPDGGRCTVARDAIISDLAREEAWKRRITFALEGAHSRAERGDARLRVAVGADHGGFSLKAAVIDCIRDLGHIAFDLGTHDENAVDYPDYARAVAEAVAARRADLGIAIDSAGIGSSIAANKVPGARAALCCDVAGAKNAREHNHANVLTLGAKTPSARQMREIVSAFLSTLEGGDRHARRVAKIDAIEVRYARIDALRSDAERS
jgi:ribose 5-phosphate isomerase B